MTAQQFLDQVQEIYGEYKLPMAREIIEFFTGWHPTDIGRLYKQVILKVKDQYRQPPCVAVLVELQKEYNMDKEFLVDQILDGRQRKKYIRYIRNLKVETAAIENQNALVDKKELEDMTSVINRILNK